MDELWRNVENNVLQLQEELEELYKMFPETSKTQQKFSSIMKCWKKVQHSLNEMDNYLKPVKSVEIKCSLLNDPDFKTSWQFWKDYLKEQHKIEMHSRAELVALKKILDISEDDPRKAIFTLEYAIGRMDKGFYKVIEKLDKSSKSDIKTPTIYKLAPQYRNMVADPLSGLVQ